MARRRARRRLRLEFMSDVRDRLVTACTHDDDTTADLVVVSEVFRYDVDWRR